MSKAVAKKKDAKPKQLRRLGTGIGRVSVRLSVKFTIKMLQLDSKSENHDASKITDKQVCEKKLVWFTHVFALQLVVPMVLSSTSVVSTMLV